MRQISWRKPPFFKPRRTGPELCGIFLRKGEPWILGCRSLRFCPASKPRSAITASRSRSTPSARRFTANGGGGARRRGQHRHRAPRLAIAAPPPGAAAPLPIGRKVSINRLVARVIEDRSPEEPFGPRVITEEVNRRFAARLKTPLDMRQVSMALRWLVAGGRIVQHEKGRPHWESKYVRRQG